MNSNSILASNLLDIIFEHRNKDYGAYVLRKNYNKRLSTALILMLALALLFSFWQMFVHAVPAKVATEMPIIPGIIVSALIPFEKITPKKIAGSLVKGSKTATGKPVIVKATLPEPSQTSALLDLPANIENTGETNPFSGSETQGSGAASKNGKDSVVPSVPVTDRNIPVISPEVLPEFPGGMHELVKFLKRNLSSPGNLEDETDVSVKVKFVVSFNGNLAGFYVEESGGAVYDNEVIRVLKKMPKWIPGKSRGENVSAYFVIPVKFSGAD